MSAEVRVFTPEQAFTLNRFQKVAALYSFLDTCARSGNPQEITQDQYGNSFRTHAEDKPFSLVFDARGVYGLHIIRRGYRKQMEAQGMGDLAEQIIAEYNHPVKQTQPLTMYEQQH